LESSSPSGVARAGFEAARPLSFVIRLLLVATELPGFFSSSYIVYLCGVEQSSFKLFMVW